jgi:hypothetical protein
VQKNKSLCNKNKGALLSCRVPIGGGLKWSNPALLIAELETRVEELKASEVDMMKASRPLICVLVINDNHYGLTISFEL